MSGRPSLLKSATTGSEIGGVARWIVVANVPVPSFNWMTIPPPSRGHTRSMSPSLSRSPTTGDSSASPPPISADGVNPPLPLPTNSRRTFSVGDTIPTIKSANPSPVRSPTLITPDAPRSAIDVGGWKPLAPFPRTIMSPTPSLCAARSGLPSLLKSSTSTLDCVVVAPKVICAWNVPFPLPSRTVMTAPEPLLPSARSALPSRLKSAVTTVSEPFASGMVTGAAKPPRPLPRSSQACASSCDTMMTSRWPSLSKSATAPPSGEPGMVIVACGPNPPAPLLRRMPIVFTPTGP